MTTRRRAAPERAQGRSPCAAKEGPRVLRSRYFSGESGTGKELAARGLHDSALPEGPFVAVNCAALTESLVESELFGHEKGAFTGATQRQEGAFQRADGGTLFLDEVGELPLETQAKLLRALESGEVRRVGGSTPEFPDVRVVAATNRDLHREVEAGKFRADLFFRLAVLTVRMPPLREHSEDIGLIARELLRRSHPDAVLDPATIPALEAYAWPGNVRELRNVLTRAYVLHGKHIRASNLEYHPWAFDGEARAAPVADAPERARVEQALAAASGNRSQAARILGIPRSSLLYKMKRYELS